MFNIKKDLVSLLGIWIEIIILSCIIFGSIIGLYKIFSLGSIIYILIGIILSEFLICFGCYFVFYIINQIKFFIKDIKSAESSF